MSKPNPSCACGCGIEVRYPWNRYVHGHYTRRITPGQMVWALREMEKGRSQRSIAKELGCSQGWVSTFRYELERERRIQNKPPIRQAELNEINRQVKENMSWRTAKRNHKAVKQYLNRFRSRTVA